MDAHEKETDSQEPLSLLEKLLLIRKEVAYLKDDVDVSFKSTKFSYVSESSIIASIRPKLDELKIWFEQSVSEIIPLKGHPEAEPYAYSIILKYTFMDAENNNKLERFQPFILTDVGIKDFGSCMTYGMRYFLYRFFIIPMDSVDPDVLEMKLQKSRIGSDNSINKKQYVEIEALLEGKEDLTDQVMTYACGVDWKKQGMNLSNIPASKYHKAIERIKSKVMGEVTTDAKGKPSTRK